MSGTLHKITHLENFKTKKYRNYCEVMALTEKLEAINQNQLKKI